MRLNADLGEHFGRWQIGNNQAIMLYIDEANIACGYHAGDALVMRDTLRLAKEHKVHAGAHVSYPDIQGFGRRSMTIDGHELGAMIQAQIAVLEGLAKCQQLTLTHVKPHGALYNDMMQNESIFETVVKSVASYHCRYPLVIQVLADNKAQVEIAEKHQVSLVGEAFADRRYTHTGLLMSRQLPGAILDEQEALAQVRSIVEDGQVTSACGSVLSINAQTLCVHSDTPEAIELCKKIRAMLSPAQLA